MVNSQTFGILIAINCNKRNYNAIKRNYDAIKRKLKEAEGVTLRELSKYCGLHRRLEQNKQMLSALYIAAGLGAQEITGMPHTPGTSDKVGSLVLEIDDVKKRIACLETECAKEKELLEKCLCAIEDDHTRMIFRLRFLHCMTWAQVSEAIGGRNTEKSVKNICYRYLQSWGGVGRSEP